MKLPNDEIVHYKSYNGISFTVERAELVRCKDCKWWDREEHNCAIRDSYGWEYKPTDYCSYGERKEK